MTILQNKQSQKLSIKKRNCIWHKKNSAGMPTCTYQCFASCADALTNCANGPRWFIDSTSNICYNFYTALEKMLLIKILFFRWHKISPEGFRQVFTKIDKHHLCQLNNVISNNLSGLDLVRRSRSHVKGHRRGGVCVLRMLLVLYLLFTNSDNKEY